VRGESEDIRLLSRRAFVDMRGCKVGGALSKVNRGIDRATATWQVVHRSHLLSPLLDILTFAHHNRNNTVLIRTSIKQKTPFMISYNVCTSTVTSKEHSRLETTQLHPIPSTSFAEQCLFYKKCAARTYRTTNASFMNGY
jgi:hypothetical protein